MPVSQRDLWAGLSKGFNMWKPAQVPTQSPLSTYPFSLLRPVVAPPRLEEMSIIPKVMNPPKELGFLFSERLSQDPLAVDFETTGGDVTNPEHNVIGVGVSDSRGSLYFDLRYPGGSAVYLWFLHSLIEHQVPIIMHNAYFDMAFMRRDLVAVGEDRWPNFLHCTYSLFRLTSTEDWPQFSWGLKAAQKHLLGWKETNETELDKWLVAEGYVSNIKLSREGELPPPGYYLTHLNGESRWAKPKKGEMHRAPVDILGHYCALDADSTYLLYTQVLWPCVQKYAALERYLSPEIYGIYTKTLIDQKLRGILLDVEGCKDWYQELLVRADKAQEDFYLTPEVVGAIEVLRQQKLRELEETKPPKLKTKVVKKEPEKYTKKGKVSVSWQAWDDKRAAPAEANPRFAKWEASVEKVKELGPRDLLNLNSGRQKAWFFYEYLGLPVLLKTKSDLPSTGKDALKGWGELGKILQKQNKLIKESQYVSKAIEFYRPDTGAIHPSVLLPGTSSGRLAGAGGLSYQQMPKSKEFLGFWKARPGYKLVELDFSSLEQVVMTELTRDPTLMSLYGPDAPKYQDVYLFNGSQLPGIGKKIRDSGYDPLNPSKESIENAKKECKKERNIAKTITLGSTYGMGPDKMRKGLSLEGIRLTEQEAKNLHTTYWKLYQGIKTYEKELVRQWQLNRGWYLNAIGRPIALSEDDLKDVCNRACQSGGHDILVIYITIVAKALDEADIEWYPWLVDMHDEMIVEVKEEDAARAADLMQNSCLKELNKVLGGLIPLQGDSVIADSWGEIKC